ncbi:DsbA family oxidoreductase [Kyrpidia tusciae]|nr:DsbA family protein [Kyrpidia tusciae]
MRITSYFDYNCVFCYIGRYRLREAAKRTGASIEWVAWSMPEGASPPPKPDDYREGVKRYVRAASEDLGLDIRLMRPVDTRDALTGMYYAREEGVEEAYHQQVFDARFLKGLDVSDRRVLTECAEAAGLSGSRYLNTLDQEKYRALLEADFQRAAGARIWTIPVYEADHRRLEVHHYDQLPTAGGLVDSLKLTGVKAED